jgi:hypothetical protein
MPIVAAIDLLSTLLLLWIFYWIWREKRKHYSIKMGLPAVALLGVGRVCDVLLEHPGLRQSVSFGLSPATYAVTFAVCGNIADVLGILFLVLGFTAIISHEAQSAQLIDQLENLLPICSYCKKYRADDNTWLPIEQYLKDNTNRPLTHGICPECHAKIRTEFIGKKST